MNRDIEATPSRRDAAGASDMSRQLTKINVYYEDGAWLAQGQHGVITEAGNLDQLVLMIRDAAEAMGVEVAEHDDMPVEDEQL